MNITDKYRTLPGIHKKALCLYLLAGAFFIIITSASISAQDVVPLNQNLGPEFDSPGMQVGGFILKPALMFGAEYNDNIYAANDRPKSDLIFTIAPRAQVQSIWSRHELRIDTGMEAGLYSAESGENYIDGGLHVNGRLDVQSRLDLKAHAGINRAHEKRGDPDFDAGLKSPPVYYSTGGGISSSYKFFRSLAEIGSNVIRLSYNDAELRQGGTADMSINDHSLYNIYALFASNIHPVVHPIFQFSTEWGNYDRSEARRDFSGYRLVTGADIILTWLTSLYVSAGYYFRDYYDREDISGFSYGLKVQWNPTQQMSVKLYSQSDISETTKDESSSAYGITSGLSAEHTVLSNLFAGASIEYNRSSYRDIGETYQNFLFGFSLNYKWNRYIDARAEYKRTNRLSSFEGGDFSMNEFTISVTGKY